VPDLHAPNAHVPGTLREGIDVERRALAARYEVTRNVLKAMMRHEALPANLRFAFALRLHQLPINTSPSRIVGRCVLNKRPRGVPAFFRINRIYLKLRMMRGQVPGMSRAAWGGYGRQLHRKWNATGF
jgi:small subunit ribosomal protein S14